MFLVALVACGGKTTAEEAAILDTKAYLDGRIADLVTASEAIRSAAPGDAAGWSDPAALEGPWRDARDAYENVEGAIAVLFPDLDASTDERYDGFIATEPDPDLFDAEIVTGVHGIERIVWAGRHPAWVVTFESGLPNYSEAARPATDDEAVRFRDELCQRLVDDTTTMRDQFEPLALDSAAAFRGVIGSMAEQYEKVTLASTGEDESRYAQQTLADMRANLAGGRATYDAFAPWLLEQDEGAELDEEIVAGFDRVKAYYDGISGDAIPAVPDTWNPDAPSEADLATEYGELWTFLSTEADSSVEGSLVHELEHAAEALGIPQI